MPDYFELNFELKKSSTVIKEFCSALIKTGLVFKSGFWGFENESLNNIIEWNQKKLDLNFKLEFTEPHSYDYKQILFEYDNFSEIRLFVMNDINSLSFEYILIIPEHDFLKYNKKKNSICRKTEKMELIKLIAKKMWSCSNILAIQTSWECSGGTQRINHIIEGSKPSIEPFCIIPRSYYKEKWELPFEAVENDGVLVENQDNWKYIFIPVHHSK